MILSTQNEHLSAVFGHEKAIEVLKNAGYDAMDMTLLPMANDNNIFNTDEYRSHTLSIRAAADRAGIPFRQAHAPFAFNWKNPNEYEERLFPRTVRAMEIAALLGAKNIVVHPLHHVEYRGHEEEMFQWNMKFYRELLPYAKEYNINVALENMWQVEKKRKYIGDNTCSRAKEFVRYIDTLDDEHFVACLDIGHSGLVGEEPWDAIRILGHDRLKALHVHDNNYRADMHTLPGMSEIDFEQVTRALADIKYDGDLTFEADSFLHHFPKEFLPTAAKFMADMGRYLISRIEHHSAQ